MADSDHITAEDWDRLGNAADSIARKALASYALKMTRRHQTGHVVIPIAAGGACAVGALMRSMTIPGGLHLSEDMMVAYLRGAIRGLDGPVHEDGRPWNGEAGHG